MHTAICGGVKSLNIIFLKGPLSPLRSTLFILPAPETRAPEILAQRRHGIVGHNWYRDPVWRLAIARTAIRSEKLDLRLSAEAKRTLAAAAAASQRSVSEFGRESTLARAEEILPDRRQFRLDEKQWKAFLAAPNAPPRPTPRLKRLFKEPSAFEKSK
jgi:uncharacterized protein (DUF1778 family)